MQHGMQFLHKKMPTPLHFLFFLSLSLAASSYTWPADTDVLEDIYMNVNGFGVAVDFYDFITPCDKFLLSNRADNSGRSTAAEWVSVSEHLTQAGS